jgi:hypothetical protein
LLFSFSDVRAQGEKPAARSELDEIKSRGKVLYEYDIAAWHLTDAVLAFSTPEGSATGYVAQKTDKGWVVACRGLNEKKDRYFIAYEAVQDLSAKEFVVTKHDRPKENAGFFLGDARALETARNDFRNENRPYNFAVIPAKPDELFVYVLPAQTEADVFSLGGVRYKISKGGQRFSKNVRCIARSLNFEFRLRTLSRSQVITPQCWAMSRKTRMFFTL